MYKYTYKESQIKSAQQQTGKTETITSCRKHYQN